MASSLIPMANVRMGLSEQRWATAHTSEESSPPLRRKPTFASATSRFLIPATSFSWIWPHTVSRSSWQTCFTAVMSR